jgi:hypothetical protein
MAKLKGSGVEEILRKAGGVFGDKGFIGTDYIHLEDMANSLHRLPSAAEDLYIIVPSRNRTLLLQGAFRIGLLISDRPSASRRGGEISGACLGSSSAPLGC